MYLITAIIESECLVDILKDLSASKIEGVTLSQVTGKGGMVGIANETVVNIDAHTRLDIVVSNDYFKELAKEAIRVNARKVERGSGKMWVTPVLEVERIRTGETNEDALSHSSIENTSVHADNYFESTDTPSS